MNFFRRSVGSEDCESESLIESRQDCEEEETVHYSSSSQGRREEEEVPVQEDSNEVEQEEMLCSPQAEQAR